MSATVARRVELRPMTPEDWPVVRAVFEEGIATGDATFQPSAPSWKEWDDGHLPECRIVAIADGVCVGWAALSAVSTRAVYRGVAEVSVYVAEAARGQGIGHRLLLGLIEASEAAEIWTLQSGIFPENRASLVLHERCGFRKVGIRERLGRMKEVWRDVVLLERRSRRVGTA